MGRKRKIIHKRPYRKQSTLLIFVEGETEENYLNYVRSLYRKNIKLQIRKKSKIRNVEEFVNHILDQYSIDEDELILLYDLEGDQKEFDKFIKNGKLVHKQTYLSQPCIEVAFLMHYKHIKLLPNTQMSSEKVEEKLLKELPQYKKGNEFQWNKYGINSEHINEMITKSTKIFNRYEDSCYTMVGLLIQNHIIGFKKI